MILFKDYSSGQKSLTVTGLVLTFLLVTASIVINMFQIYNGNEAQEGLVWACIAFFTIFAAMYWNKRFRASATGIELVSEASEIKEMYNDVEHDN